MHRRAFVRLVGGGVVVAAAAPLAGCDSGLPPEAMAAWQGPGQEPDLRRWILGHAILAPHSHNLQSWLVDLRTPGEILLRCDLTRLLPETDPFSRQIMMSQGTFLELLDLAARERGRRAEITLFPEGEFGPEKIDERPVARIRLVADANVSKDPLFAQILQAAHQSQRLRPGAPGAGRGLAGHGRSGAAVSAALRLRRPRPGRAIEQHRAIANEAWRIELTTPRTMLESYKVLRVGAAEIAQHRDGLSMTDPMVVWMTRLGLFDRSKAPAPDDYATTSQIKDFGAKIASTPGFLWMVTEGNDRVDAGQRRPRLRPRAARRHRPGRGDAAAAAGAAGVPGTGAALRRRSAACWKRPRRRRRSRCGRASASRRRCSRRRGAGWRRTWWPADAGARPRAGRPGARRRRPACARAHARPRCHRGTHPRRRGRGAGARRLRRRGRQCHRAPGRRRQGADLPLFRRPARTAARLGRERPLLAARGRPAGPRSAGAAGLPAAERYARFFEHFIDELRRRPLTLEILAAETDGAQRAHRHPGGRARSLGRTRPCRCWAAPNSRARPHLQGVTLLLVAGVQYLLLRSRRIRIFGGVDLRSDAGWLQLKQAIRALAQRGLRRDRRPDDADLTRLWAFPPAGEPPWAHPKPSPPATDVGHWIAGRARARHRRPRAAGLEPGHRRGGAPGAAGQRRRRGRRGGRRAGRAAGLGRHAADPPRARAEQLPGADEPAPRHAGRDDHRRARQGLHRRAGRGHARHRHRRVRLRHAAAAEGRLHRPGLAPASTTGRCASRWAWWPASRRSTSRAWCRAGCSRWRWPAATPSS